MAEKKNLHESSGGLAVHRVDVRVLFDGIAWRELKEGTVGEQRASTRRHERSEDGDFASIPEHEYDRLADLGAVAKKGTKAEKEAAKEAAADDNPPAEPPADS